MVRHETITVEAEWADPYPPQLGSNAAFDEHGNLCFWKPEDGLNKLAGFIVEYVDDVEQGIYLVTIAMKL